MTRALVAITGASGALYGVQLVRRLLDGAVPTGVVVSSAARKVLAIEHGLTGDPAEYLIGAEGRRPHVYEPADITAAPASGSSAPDTMIIAPCSMGTVARIAAGTSGNLIERAADVMLKERRPLVVMPRETPYSTLHLRNLLALSELGVRVVPASPAFYFNPESIDDLVEFVVDRALQSAGIDLPLRHPWVRPGERVPDREARE